MLLEKVKILEFNQYIKSDKMPYIIYSDIEPLIKKIHGCTNNPKNSLTLKVREHILCGYSMPTKWDFDSIKASILYIEGKIVLKSFGNL